MYVFSYKNNKLPLLFLENRNAQVAIKTPRGLSDRINIRKIIMQGSVWGSLCCVVLMDKLGKLAYSNPDLLYMYKGVVGCPPLQMVDNVLCVQNCSEKSQFMNTTVNTFMELEKLTLSKTKCHKLHIGKHHRECPELFVHGEVMEESKAEKYLGDIIHNSGSIKPNLARRLSRGWGKVSEILAILKEAPLGHYKVISGFILRKAMLLNTMLFNSEAWHNFDINQVEAFEKIYEALIRGVVIGHSKIPVPAISLETGQVPVRFILACRRILYLQTILKRNPDELILRVYTAQKHEPIVGDFCELVQKDFQLLNLQLTDECIASMSKYDLKALVKSSAKKEAFKYLISIKENKSKLDNICYLNNYKTLHYIILTNGILKSNSSVFPRSEGFISQYTP